MATRLLAGEVRQRLPVDAADDYDGDRSHPDGYPEGRAVFTKGKVAGSFANDTFLFHSTHCSTGAVTFSASRVAF